MSTDQSTDYYAGTNETIEHSAEASRLDPVPGRHAASLRGARTLCSIGGIPVEYKGGSIPPPDQRRSYN